MVCSTKLSLISILTIWFIIFFLEYYIYQTFSKKITKSTKYNWLLPILIILNIAIFIGLKPNMEGFSHCRDCSRGGWRSERSCMDCLNCGWCIDPNGDGYCVQGDANGPLFNDCAQYFYNKPVPESIWFRGDPIVNQLPPPPPPVTYGTGPIQRGANQRYITNPYTQQQPNILPNPYTMSYFNQGPVFQAPPIAGMWNRWFGRWF